jgi:integrase/recombinase XerD
MITRTSAATCPTCLASPKPHNPADTGHTEDQLQISYAMHLYDAGVPLPYIRDILGHVDLSTTEIYARASTEAKRKALEAVYADVVTADLAEWNQNPELLSWLASL